MQRTIDVRIILDTRKSNDHDAIPHAKPRNSRNLRDGDAVGVLLVVRLLLLGAGLAGDGAGMGGAHDRIVRFDSKDWVGGKRKRIRPELRDVEGALVSMTIAERTTVPNAQLR